MQTSTQNTPKLYTRTEAVAVLNKEFGLPISIWQLVHWASKPQYKGYGPKCVRIGKPVFYPEQELYNWARQVQEKGIPAQAKEEGK